MQRFLITKCSVRADAIEKGVNTSEQRGSFHAGSSWIYWKDFLSVALDFDYVHNQHQTGSGTLILISNFSRKEGIKMFLLL